MKVNNAWILMILRKNLLSKKDVVLSLWGQQNRVKPKWTCEKSPKFDNNASKFPLEIIFSKKAQKIWRNLQVAFTFDM